MKFQDTLPAPASVLNSGVDWLTATAYRVPSREPFHALAEDLISQSAGYGNEVSTWRAGGYHGRASSGIMYGVRHDTHIIKLSSDVAREHWKDVTELASNVSRIDLQVTFEFDNVRDGFIADQRARALAARGTRGRRSNVTLIQSSVDGDTLYLGKRTSDVYARCYDKGREERSTVANKIIRQEIEFKGDRARDMASALRAVPSPATECQAIVSSYMRRFEVQTIAGDAPRREDSRGKATQSDAGLRWLRASVAPSVKRLVNAGRLDEVLDALGLSSLVEARTVEHEATKLKEVA